MYKRGELTNNVSFVHVEYMYEYVSFRQHRKMDPNDVGDSICGYPFTYHSPSLT